MKKREQWENLEKKIHEEVKQYQELLNSINIQEFHQEYTDYFTSRDILSIYQKLLLLREGYQSLIEITSSDSDACSNQLLDQCVSYMENEGVELSSLLLTIIQLTKMEYSSSKKSSYLEFNEFVWKLILMYQEREDCSVVVVNIVNQYLERLTPLEYGLLKIQQYTKDYDKNRELSLQPLRILGKRYLDFESTYLLIYETVLEMLQSESDQLSIDEILKLFGGIYETEFYRQNFKGTDIQKRYK